MLKTKSFLSVDFGAGTLKLAEFEPAESGTLRLKAFALRPLGLEGSSEAARPALLQKALQEVIASVGPSTKTLNVCAPGFHVFSKFVKLPPVDSSKITQIIQYEAQQNVPFPLEEVVWDYQILGTAASGEMEVLLVAIKADVVENLFKAAESASLRMELVDSSPAALCNAFRFNYSDLEGCTMVLDIGAKTSNVLFFEKGRMYSRGINIGANSITQDFAAEAKIRFAEAEQFKIAEGFVSLGGAYEEPENPRAAQVSKVARQVMTRLHIQVNQTIQFYRSQQGGSAPVRVFLAGGASIMPYTSQFFAEKLNLPVEYFNPFRNLEIGPAVNVEDLAKTAHAFGEVVGLGLRNLAQCPVEMNLMPKSVRRRQELNRKKPYFIATALALIAVVAAFGWLSGRVATIKQTALEELSQAAGPLQNDVQRLVAEEQKLKSAQEQADQMAHWIQERYLWLDVLNEVRHILVETERTVERQAGIEVGLWIESFSPETPGGFLTATEPVQAAAAEEEAAPRPTFMMDPILAKRYGLVPMMPAAPVDEGPKLATNEVAIIKVTCRGVNRENPPTANHALALELQNRLKASTNFFDPDRTQLSGEIERVGPESTTFTFSVDLRLKQPIKL